MEINGKVVNNPAITSSDCGFLKKTYAYYIERRHGGNFDYVNKDKSRLEKIGDKIGVMNDAPRSFSIFAANARHVALIIGKITY